MLSADEIVAQVPGQWTSEGTRPPNTEPVGMQSSEIKLFAGEDGDELEHGVVVFDTAENAVTFMHDENSDDYDPEEIGDEGFSGSSFGTTLLLTRYRNVVIQETGSPHISNLRAVAQEQLGAIEK